MRGLPSCMMIGFRQVSGHLSVAIFRSLGLSCGKALVQTDFEVVIEAVMYRWGWIMELDG